MESPISLLHHRGMILLVGASASGKTEIAKYLFQRYGMTKAITHTTRPIRPSETPDVDYHFVTREEFLALKEKDAFVETTEYNGNFYGCSKAEVSDDKCIILDPAGIASFLALHDPHVVTFFIRASKETRFERMRMRGDDPAAIERRLEVDEAVFDERAIAPCDFYIESDVAGVPELGDAIYDDYCKRIGYRP